MKDYEVFSLRTNNAEGEIVGRFQVEDERSDEKTDGKAERIFTKEYVDNPDYALKHLKLVEVIWERNERVVAVSKPDNHQN